MKDYKKIIKYLEKTEKLLDTLIKSDTVADNIDLLHAKINLQFAIMDLKAINQIQDAEIESMIEQYKQDYISRGIEELINDKK